MRIIWFIDAEYLLRAAPGPFDYLKLKTYIEKQLGGPLYEGHFLNSAPQMRSDAQEGFYTWLKSAAPHGPRLKIQLYRLRNIRCKCPACGEWFDRNIQSGVDVGIVTLLMRLAAADHFDRALISIGDGEYQDALAFVKVELGKEIWLCGFDGTINPELQCHADHVLWLDEGWDGFKKGERRRRDEEADQDDYDDDDDEYDDGDDDER